MSPNKLDKAKRTKKAKIAKRAVAKRPPPFPAIIAMAIGCMLLATSLLLPWGALNVKTTLGGLIPVTLDASVSEYGVSYTADLSGTQGIIQGTGNINRKITDKKVFLTGLGSFQELIGFLKGSSKYRNHTIEIFTVPQNYATVVIETYSATIPWWPVGVSEQLTVTVRMSEQPQNITRVSITRVWFELHQKVNNQDRYKVLWESKPNDTLTKLGDTKSYTTKVTVNEDLGNFSVVGRAELLLVDKDGVSASGPGHEIKSFIDNPKMINLWTISSGRTARIGMLLMAMPLTVISLIMLAASAVAGYARTRWAWKLAAVAAVLGLLSVLFFYLGVGALIELTGYGDWYSWNPAGPGLSSLGGVLGIIGFALLFVENRKMEVPIEAEKEDKPVKPKESEE